MHRRGVLAGLAASCATVPNADEGLLHAMGAEIAFIHRRGHAPTIVFEAGLGDGLEVWRPVLDRLDPHLSYFAYSRPGYGESVATGAPASQRTSADAASLLHAVVQGARVTAPYVMVGHSLGGLYVARYAADHVADVAGLVFVDARPPGFRASCEAHGIQFCALPAAPPSDWPPHIVAEMTGIGASEEMAPQTSEIANIPATVIVSTRAWPGEGGIEGFALWQEQQAALAGGFRTGRLVPAPGAGHYVHRDQPALVAREIEALVRAVSCKEENWSDSSNACA